MNAGACTRPGRGQLPPPADRDSWGLFPPQPRPGSFLSLSLTNSTLTLHEHPALVMVCTLGPTAGAAAGSRGVMMPDTPTPAPVQPVAWADTRSLEPAGVPSSRTHFGLFFPHFVWLGEWKGKESIKTNSENKEGMNWQLASGNG